MTEGVNSSYTSFVQSNEDRNDLFRAWQTKLNKQTKRRDDAYAKRRQTKFEQDSEKEKEKDSAFFERTDDKNRENVFLERDIQAERDSVFLSNDIKSESPFLKNETQDERESVFLSNDIKSESPFLRNETNPDNQPFLTPQERTNEESPFTLKQTEENEEEFKINDYVLPKNTSIIVSELKRNPMASMLTARDIANEYNISYQSALDIFKTINADANGVVKEFNLPDENATVSYLV